MDSGKGQRRQYAERGGRGGGGVPPPPPLHQAASAADATAPTLSSPLKGRKSDVSSAVSPRKVPESSQSLPTSKNGGNDLTRSSAGSRDILGSGTPVPLPPKEAGEANSAGANPISCPPALHAPDKAAASSRAAASCSTKSPQQPLLPNNPDAPVTPPASFKEVATRTQPIKFSNNLYMRIKLCNPAEFPRAKFYATDALHEAVLKGLSGIDAIRKTGLCIPNGITIFLERLNPTILRGYFFMIGISSPGSSSPPFGKLILEAQQPAGFFEFELPVTSIAKEPKGSEAKSKSKETSLLIAKTKVSFSYDAKTLTDMISLQFTITIPPLGVADPITDSARLLAHLIYSKDSSLPKEEQDALTAEDIRYLSTLLKPMRCNQTQFGNFQIRALTGSIPLDLDNAASEDFYTLRRLIFGHICGMDYRSAIHHRFHLYVPLLNDIQGLRNPSFKSIVQTHEEILSIPGITDLMQVKSKAFRRNELRSASSESSSSSDNEVADLSAPRQAHRLAILRSLPIPARVESTTEYPNLENPSFCSIDEAIKADTLHSLPVGQISKPLNQDPFWLCGHCVLFDSTLFQDTMEAPQPLTTPEGCHICPQQAAAFCPNCKKNFCISCQSRLMEKAEKRLAEKRSTAPTLHPVDLYTEKKSQRTVSLNDSQSQLVSSKMFKSGEPAINSKDTRKNAKGVSFMDPMKTAHSAAISLHNEVAKADSASKGLLQPKENPSKQSEKSQSHFACMNFRQYGKCRYGEKCRHSHDPNAPNDPNYKNKPTLVASKTTAAAPNTAVESKEAEPQLKDNSASSSDYDSDGSDGDSASNGNGSEIDSDSKHSSSSGNDNSGANSSRISGSDDSGNDDESQTSDSHINNPEVFIPHLLQEMVDEAALSADNPSSADQVGAPSRTIIEDNGTEREIPLSPGSKPNPEFFVWNRDHRKWAYASDAPAKNPPAPEMLQPQFTVRAAAAFPNINACREAKKIDVIGDGQCLFSSVIGATSLLRINIGISPKMTPLQLRTITLHFLRENRHVQALYRDCNLAEAPHQIDTASPEEMIQGSMPWRFANGGRCRSPTKATNYKHSCGGPQCGELFVAGKSEIYLDLDSYIAIMSRPEAYAEDLEIMALSAIYKLSIAVWVPERDGDHYRDQYDNPKEALQCFYHPNAIATIVLKNTDGRGHYEYLDFSQSAEPKFTAVRRSRRGASTVAEEAPPEEPMIGSPFQPLLVPLRPFPPTNPIERFCMKQLYFPSELKLCKCPCKPGAPDALDLKCKCKWRPISDPWSSKPTPPLPMFAAATDKLLGTISLINVSEQSESMATQFLFYLHRIAVMANMLYITYIANIAPNSEQGFTLIRDVLVQFYDACALIQTHATNLPVELGEDIQRLSQGIIIGLSSSRDIIETALCALFTLLPEVDQNPNPSQSASQSSAFSVSDMDRVASHYQECMKLQVKAFKANEMAKIKLQNVLADNQMIYALQIEQLANNLSDACTEINRRIAIINADPRASAAAKDQLPRMLHALSGIEQALSDIHRISIAIRACKPPAAPATPVSGDKRSLSGKNGRKANLRQAAQTATIDLHIQDATKAAASVARKMRNDRSKPADSFTYLANMPSAAEAENGINSQEFADLQDQAHEHRGEANSSKSLLMGEAINVDASGAHADSFDSAINDGSQTSGDIAFVSNSPMKASESRHPRHAAAHETINEAANQDPLLHVSKIKDLTHTAYCRRGHLLDRLPTILKGTLAQCRFCIMMKSARHLVTCNCFKTSEGPFYACNDCIGRGKTYPAPPACPSLECTGQCLIKHIAISKDCFQCKRYLPPNTRAWFCTDDSCKPAKIICVQCHNENLPPNVIPTPLPTTPAYTSSPRGPPAPMPGSKGGSK